MVHDRYTAEDRSETKDRLDAADARLEAWGRWQLGGSPDRLSYARESPIVRAMTPSEEELQAGARHLRDDITCTDEEALEVDALLARWKTEHRSWWKVARKEYLTAGPSEKKALELGLNRAEYRKQLDLLRVAAWIELDLGARNGKRSGKLAQLSAGKART